MSSKSPKPKRGVSFPVLALMPTFPGYEPVCYHSASLFTLRRTCVSQHAFGEIKKGYKAMRSKIRTPRDGGGEGVRSSDSGTPPPAPTLSASSLPRSVPRDPRPPSPPLSLPLRVENPETAGVICSSCECWKTAGVRSAERCSLTRPLHPLSVAISQAEPQRFDNDHTVTASCATRIARSADPRGGLW